MRQPLDWFPDRRGADFRRSPRACSTGNQGTYLSERLAMIQNLVTDLGIGRHMSDQEILDAYDRYGTCGYHAIGGCRMGSDAEAVVDPALRVKGVTGLRVMDTSIMPQIPSGNTNGPVMAMAWRAADIILRDATA